MLTLDQIRLLERKVNAAVTRIAALREENSLLEGKLGKALDKIDELEARIDRFKHDQVEIEQGILAALGQLDKLEDMATSDDEEDLDDDDAFEGVPSETSPGDGVSAPIGEETVDRESTEEDDPADINDSPTVANRSKDSEAAEPTPPDRAGDSDETESGASDELDIF